MNIKEVYLIVSPYNRPGTKRPNTTALACHYIGNPNTTAMANRNYFENLRTTKKTKASCHYIIGLDGEILRLIPEEELSYCTNKANSYTISIEACHPDATGRFLDATYKSYIDLCADLCKRYKLDPLNGGLIRHYDVTGKGCPKYFVDNPSAWKTFKKDVHKAMQSYAIGWMKDDNGWWYAYTEKDYYKNGWQIINGYKYYFNQDGYAHKGWQEIGGKWYYFEPTPEHDLECAMYVSDSNGVQTHGRF